MTKLLGIQGENLKAFLALEVNENFDAKRINNTSDFLKGKHTIQYRGFKDLIDFYSDNTHMYSMLIVRYNTGVIQGYSMPSSFENELENTKGV